MKIIKYYYFLPLFLLVLLSSCSGDDNSMEPTFFDIEGTVLQQMSCQSPEGTVYEIELSEDIKASDGEILGTIGAVNLPNGFQEEGTKIVFNMRQAAPNEKEGACVSLYSDSYFYVLAQIKTLNDDL